MTASPVKTPIDPGFVTRVAQGLRYMITGVSEAWMGPTQPMAPVADKPSDQTQGRAFDYPIAINLQQKQKTFESSTGVTYDDLRGLADNFDLVRLCIETRKDQICGLSWKIQPIDDTMPGEEDPRCKKLTSFLKFPDRQHDWESWLRIILEDLFVIDAPCIYPRPTRGGGIYALEPIDGATIKRVIDAYGRTPMPPDPAYQQILHGMPAVDYTADELIFRPRNPRSYKILGFSPVEQIVTTINIAMRRQLHQLEYFTEGNLPNVLLSTPATWTPDQIIKFQNWWDQTLTGQSKRKGRFVPNGVTTIDLKENALGDGPADLVMNEWLARVVCFCFSISPTALVATNNRATSDSQKETAEDEGLAPVKRWVKSLMDYIVQVYFDCPDLEFGWVPPKELDELKQAQINEIYLAAKVITPDEVRKDLGLDPLTAAQKEELNPEPLQVDPNVTGGVPHVAEAKDAKPDA